MRSQLHSLVEQLCILVSCADNIYPWCEVGCGCGEAVGCCGGMGFDKLAVGFKTTCNVANAFIMLAHPFCTYSRSVGY